MSLRIIGVVLATALIGGVFVACNDDDETPEEAQSALCDSLDALGEDIAAFGQLTAESSIDDIEAAREDIASGAQDVVEAADELDEAEVNAFESSVDDLESAVDDISGDQSVPAALESIAEEAAAVDSSFEAIFAASGCPES